MYSTPQGDVNVEAVVRDEMLWLTQKAMAQLFGVDRSVISKHLNNVFDESELDKEVVQLKEKPRPKRFNPIILMQSFLSAIV